MSFSRQPPDKFKTLLERHSRSAQRQRERERQRETGGGVAGGERGGVRKVAFCGLTFESNDQVFVPRAGTAEAVVQRARQLFSDLWNQRRRHDGASGEGGGGAGAEASGGATAAGLGAQRDDAASCVRVLDLGTGSGCLLLATIHAGVGVAAQEVCEGGDGGGAAEVRVWGVGIDNDEDAVELAARNAELLGAAASTAWVRADFGRLHDAEVHSKHHARTHAHTHTRMHARTRARTHACRQAVGVCVTMSSGRYARRSGRLPSI